jgi:diguanylate cyclase (GGDEF)-like protein
MADGTQEHLEHERPAEDQSVFGGARLAIADDTPRRRGHWLLTVEAVVEVLLIGVMVTLTWGSIGLDLEQQHRQLIGGAQRDSANLARAAAESIGQVVASVDDVLRLSRLVRAGNPQNFDIAAWASGVNADRPVALELATIDTKGMLAASSLGPVQTPIDLSQTDFFRYHSTHDTDDLFIGRPAFGNGSKSWSVLFTRRLSTPDGLFAGCIAASINATWLTRLYNALDIGHGTLMLVGMDGTVRAYAAGGQGKPGAVIGRDIAHSALLDAAAAHGHGTLSWNNPLDMTPQIVGFQRLPGYPLVVAIGLDSREVLAPYGVYARQDTTFGICLTLLILSAGLFLLGNTRRILASRQVLQDAVDAISQGIIMVDRSGYVAVMNRRIRQLLFVPAGAAAGRVTLARLLGQAGMVESDADAARALASDVWQPPESDDGTPYEQARPDGTIVEIQTHRLENGGFVRTYADVTERKRAELKITYLAYHDSLTGLANRRLFRDRVATAILHSQPGNQGCAVLSVDLDGFKYANDMYGHTFGDAVLLNVAGRLNNEVAHSGVVARFGGDEFFVLLDAPDPRGCVEALAGRLIVSLSEPYQIDNREIVMSASIGIAQYPADGQTVDDLLTNADTALYRAKEAGHGTFRAYDPAMALLMSERRQMEQELRGALALEQLHLEYQPVFDCKTCRICRFEALVRWRHPTLGDVPPDVFIPVAEESGQIVTLGQWVVETACAEAVRWPDDVAVAVNLSPKQFLEPNLVRSIAVVLAKTGLPASRLTVEVTEGVLIDNIERASAALATLRAVGVRIALDDFGTGYSSLSYLHRFPISSIKIDKTFVKSLRRNDEADAIVRAILTLGQSLGLPVVAEGIETRAQMEWLVSAGCTEVQGYLLGRAIPPEAIPDCLAKAAAAMTPVS